jgi:hypothetical protein
MVRSVSFSFFLGLLPTLAIAQLMMQAGCNLHAEEPRQREEYSNPPAQYGETRFGGMRLDGVDAGRGTAP